MGDNIARIARFVILCAALRPSVSIAQQTEWPRLPNGGAAPPASLLAGLPAEAAALYRRIPEAENAETPYLIALSEFERSMADCWPEERRSERGRHLVEREKRLDALFDAAGREIRPIERRARDAVLAEYRTGWDGLINAQRRERCRFAIAVDAGAAVPHAYAARRAARVAGLLAMADLEKCDIDAALGRLSVVLRLSRDVRPGGNTVCQIMSVAIDASARDHIALPILRSPALGPEHCDRLIALWRAHEREGLDPFRALIFPEALTVKATIAKLRSNPRTRDSIVAMFRNDAPGRFAEALDELTGAQRRDDTATSNRRAGDRLASMTDADFASAETQINRYFERWWEFGPRSFAARVDAAPGIFRETVGDDPLLGQLVPGATLFVAIAHSSARESFTVGAVQSLAAVRRWALANGSPPRDLGTATAAAGLPSAPRDPCADAALKLAFRAGSPLIYSIGPTSKNNGADVDGLIASRHHGDWVIWLSPKAPGR